jgi:hypothetical protein
VIVTTALVHPAIRPTGFVVNVIEGGVPHTQSGHDVEKLRRRDVAYKIRFHTNPPSKKGGERLPQIIMYYIPG